jgi:hypothetical protein
MAMLPLSIKGPLGLSSNARMASPQKAVAALLRLKDPVKNTSAEHQ